MCGAAVVTVITATADPETHCSARMSRPHLLREIMPAAGLLAALLLGLMIATFSQGGVVDRYIVIASPGSGTGETIRLIGEAKGGLQQFTRFPNVIIASSGAPDFPERLREAGAWLVLPSPMATGCFTEISGEPG